MTLTLLRGEQNRVTVFSELYIKILWNGLLRRKMASGGEILITVKYSQL